jgi:hypothetical protein
MDSIANTDSSSSDLASLDLADLDSEDPADLDSEEDPEDPADLDSEEDPEDPADSADLDSEEDPEDPANPNLEDPANLNPEDPAYLNPEDPYPGPEVDAAATDIDDGYETGDTDTTSLRDCNGVYENGRLYPSYGAKPYPLPIDDAERRREELRNGLIRKVCGDKLHFAPIREDGHVTDIGTGDALWAIDCRCMF